MTRMSRTDLRQAGIDAYKADLPISDNPFEYGTESYYVWREGWLEMRIDDDTKMLREVRDLLKEVKDRL